MLHFSPATQMEETKQAVEALVSMSTTSTRKKKELNTKIDEKRRRTKIVFFCSVSPGPDKGIIIISSLFLSLFSLIVRSDLALLLLLPTVGRFRKMMIVISIWCGRGGDPGAGPRSHCKLLKSQRMGNSLAEHGTLIAAGKMEGGRENGGRDASQKLSRWTGHGHGDAKSRSCQRCVADKVTEEGHGSRN